MNNAITHAARHKDERHRTLVHGHHALTSQIVVSKVKRNVKKGMLKDKYAVTVPALLVGTSIAMQQTVGENTLAGLRRILIFIVYFISIAPFLAPLFSLVTPDGRGVFVNVSLATSGSNHNCTDQNTSSIAEKFNAYDMCGYDARAWDDEFWPGQKQCNGTLPVICCVIKNITLEFRSSMEELREELRDWHDVPITRIPQFYIRNACYAPTRSKLHILVALRILMALCALPLILLTNDYLLAGVQSYIRQHNMLRHLDSMITPSVFVEEGDNPQFRVSAKRVPGVCDIPATLNRRKARKEAEKLKKTNNNAGESKTHAVRPRVASHHTQHELIMNRLPPLISFHNTRNLRNYFHLRNALRGLYSQINARSDILLKWLIIIVTTCVFLFAWVVGFGSLCVPSSAWLPCSVPGMYVSIDFILLVGGVIIMAFILIVAGAYGLYKGNLQSSIANRALISIKNSILHTRLSGDAEEETRESIETMRRLFQYDMEQRPFTLFGVRMDATGVGSVQTIGAAVVSLLVALFSHRFNK